jgi:hypothetical protein
MPWRVVLAASILICPALARDEGRFNQLPVDLRAWFRSQKSPKAARIARAVSGDWVKSAVTSRTGISHRD